MINEYMYGKNEYGNYGYSLMHCQYHRNVIEDHSKDSTDKTYKHNGKYAISFSIHFVSVNNGVNYT